LFWRSVPAYWLRWLLGPTTTLSTPAQGVIPMGKGTLKVAIVALIALAIAVRVPQTRALILGN